jgi:hypothetical protein
MSRILVEENNRLSVGLNRRGKVRPIPWTPANISTRGWWDASQEDTITSENSYVSQLDDISGNDFHMVQGNGSLQPRTGLLNLNGLNTISNTTNGTGRPHLNATMTMTQDHMFFCALNIYESVFSQGPFSWQNSSNYWGLRVYRNNNTTLLCGGSCGADLALGAFPGRNPLNRPTLFSSSFDGSGAGTKEVWIEGSSEGSNAYTTIGSNNIFRLGKNSDQSCKYRIGEAFFVPRVDENIRLKAEGYLAWKWGFVDDLPNDHPYKEEPPYYFPWTPSDIGTTTWFDAADASTITIDTGVSQWDDKSGNGHHASQTSAGNQPTYNLTNKEVVFDGNDILAVGNNNVKTDPFKDLQNFAIMLVGSWPSGSTNANVFASWRASGSGGTSDGWNFRDRSGLCLTLRPGINDSGSFVYPTFGEDFIGTGVRYSNSNINTRINGTITHTANNSGTVAYNSNTNISALGGLYASNNWTNPQNFYLKNGSTIKELIVKENATEEDVQKIEGYLAHKWGLADNLPSNHPYKTDPPIN